MNKAHIVFAHTASTAFINDVARTTARSLADRRWSITTTDLAHWAVAHTEAELRRVTDCNLLVLVFPMVWASVPATLKQWIEGVFSDQPSHEEGMPANSRGGMRGKKAIVVAATEHPECMQRYDSIETSMAEMLGHLLEGTLNYLGFYVLRPLFLNSMKLMQPTDTSSLLHEVESAFSQIERRPGFYGLLQPEPGPSHPLML